MKDILVIHHSADFDGLFCREIARKFLGDTADYVGWDFGDPPVLIRKARAIYVLDLPVDRVFGFDFNQPETIPAWCSASGDCPLVWIDHHKSSIESHPSELAGYRIDGVAACRLAWQWFTHPANPTPRRDPDGNPLLPLKEEFVARKVSEPYAVQLAGEYDIWDKRNPDAETFQFGLRSQELGEDDWDALLTMSKYTGFVDDLLVAGQLLQRYQQQTDAGIVNHRSYVVEFEGLKFLALNTARCNSLTFAVKDVPETGHDALLGYYFNGAEWRVSLYHANHRKDLDLSEIAKKYGGGGHRGACGFALQSLPPFAAAK